MEVLNVLSITAPDRSPSRMQTMPGKPLVSPVPADSDGKSGAPIHRAVLWKAGKSTQAGRKPPRIVGVALSTVGIYHGCCVGKAGPGKAMPSSPTDEEFMQLSAYRLARLTALAVLLPGAAPPREGSLEGALQFIKPD